MMEGSSDRSVAWTVPSCEKCGAAIMRKGSLVCQQCGWYASIKSYVDIDQNWESAADPELGDAMGWKSAKECTSYKVLPPWAWLLIACVSAVIGESVMVRLVTPDGSHIRTVWSVSQFFLGVGAFAACYAVGVTTLMREEGSMSFLDGILKPLRSWGALFQKLPRRQWVCHAGFSGFTAAVMSMLVIGSLPYHMLLDWGIEMPPNQDLMGAIQQMDSSGEAGAGEKPKPEPRETEDVVILGYKANEDGLVIALYVGAEHKGKLLYVGQVTPQLSVHELRELGKSLAAASTKRPVIDLDFKAQWVLPQFLCRVNYIQRNEKGGMEDMRFEKLLGKVN